MGASVSQNAVGHYKRWMSRASVRAMKSNITIIELNLGRSVIYASPLPNFFRSNIKIETILTLGLYLINGACNW